MTRQQIRLVTGARLHFGLLNTIHPYGGVGMMIEQPATAVTLRRSDGFRCDHPERDRLRAIAAAFADLVGMSGLPPCELTISDRPNAHSGLGSGTQLAMAVAEALCCLFETPFSTETLALKIAQRGRRSAVGIHGYYQGGLIFEEAQSDSNINPIQFRANVPQDWCVAIFQSRQPTTAVSGEFERQQFAKLLPALPEHLRQLRQLIHKGLVPALKNQDFEFFTKSVQQYNRLSGLLFEPVQQGPYNGRVVASLVESLIARGAKGVGQSSWGPTVFAWFESSSQAEQFICKHQAQLNTDVRLSSARNVGRTIVSSGEHPQ